LIPYENDSTVDHQCSFQRIKPTTDILHSSDTGEERWEYNGTVYQFIGFEKARREVLYNTLIEFGILMKLAMPLTMCSDGTHSKVRIGKNLSDAFAIQSGLK
jgi:hypothetical protein